MILCNHFVFFHVPRTGGTWFRRVLADHAPPAWDLEIVQAGATSNFAKDQHWNSAMLEHRRPDLARVPRIAFVRNPWELYVSLFEHWRSWGIFPEMTGDFTVFIRHLNRNVMPLSAWVADLSKEGVPVSIGKFENLREDALRLLRECVDVPEALEEQIRGSAPLNASQHGDYRHYYSPDSRELIRKIDRTVIESYGYEFSDS